MIREERILSRNCRGVRSATFLLEMKELKRRYNPMIIVLMEPRISGELADAVCWKIGKNYWVRSESEGFSGGIWVLWSEEDVEVKLRYAHASFLHFAVKSNGGKQWEFTAIYANPNATERKHIWGKLDELRIKAPWILIGDFNCVLKDEERSSGRGASSSFQAWVRQQGLVDLEYDGAAFTWSHGTSIQTRRAACLDGAICDVDWRNLFSSAQVRHLAHAYSDHCPILLEMEEGTAKRLGERPFRFEAAWTLHEEFEEYIRSAWEPEGSL